MQLNEIIHHSVAGFMAMAQTTGKMHEKFGTETENKGKYELYTKFCP
jgi:hypothetical protein